MNGSSRRAAMLGGSAFAAVSIYFGFLIGKGALAPCRNPIEDQAARDAFRRVGDAYLAEIGEGAERSRLVNIGLPGDLAATVHHNFEVNDLVWCDGWLLARSEAEYCAHVALQHQIG